MCEYTESPALLKAREEEEKHAAHMLSFWLHRTPLKDTGAPLPSCPLAELEAAENRVMDAQEETP